MDLKAIRAGDSASLEVRAKLARLEATSRAQEATIEKLKNEREAYQATEKLPRLRPSVCSSLIAIEVSAWYRPG